MTTIVLEVHLLLRFLSVLLLFFIFTSSFTLVVGLAGCHPRHIQALVKFKNEFDSSHCNQTDYFNGVRCNDMTGEVTELHLPSTCLTGILKPNSSLFELHHLRYLNLSHNNFISTSLPLEFSNLNRLEVLSLSSSGFLGQVPSSFSNLTWLTQLDLSHNKLTGNFQVVQNFTKLSILDLSYNQFSGTIPSSLLSMPFLSHVDLGGNYLIGPIEVPNSSWSSRLEYLFLGRNHFDGQVLEPISKLISLKDLSLAFINVSYPVDVSLFSSLKSLENLELSGNILSATSVSSDVPPKLYRLMMKNCNINEFPKFLKTLQKLERLDISDNRIKGKVPEWLWRLPRLSIVSLANNSFNGFDGPAETLGNSSVTMLDFSLNAFTGSLPVPPHSITFFWAWNNSFTGEIPLSICNRSSLDGLDLSYNNFSGSVPQCLSKLKTVNLRKNNLQGSIPNTFYSNSVLQTLDVGYNQISGKLPRSLVNCSFLRFLSVDHNNIKDVFPFWLKVLPKLQVLTLRANTFYGPISPPQGPLGFPELRILDVSDNNFTGSLSPEYFVNWSASSNKIYRDEQMYMGDYSNALLKYYFALDLQYKGLSLKHGKVPAFYAAIDFSSNGLAGHIPESIGLLTALIALNLSNNSFTGHIPMSFANVSQLESLDLSRNKLSGKIPQELKTLSFLAYINVSHNQLKGEIPQGTQIIGQPKSSFEGNAGLCGLPLQDTCFDTGASPTQRQKQEDNEEEAEVLNWRGVAIGYFPGVLFGLAIGHIVALYKPEWLVKIIGQDKGRNR